MMNYKPKPYLRRFMRSFKNKVVWITGASSGIGKEAAIQLSKAGAKIIVSSRNEKELTDLRNNVAHPESILVMPLDLTRPETFAEAVEIVYNQFEKVDIVFNAAGVSQRSYVIDTDISVDRKLMEINYFGTVALTKAILPRMLKEGGGHFAVVTSVVGKFGFGVRSAYSASKHALHGFFESLYVELNKQGIEITLIVPGPIQTEISKNALDGAGNPTGVMDVMQQKGMPVDVAVNEMLHAIANTKREIIIGGFKEKLGVKLKAFLPKLFFKMASKQNPRGELKM